MTLSAQSLAETVHLVGELGFAGAGALQKRRKPGFTESYYGFRSFSELLEEAEKRQMLKLQRDEKSGGYILNLI